MLVLAVEAEVKSFSHLCREDHSVGTQLVLHQLSMADVDIYVATEHILNIRLETIAGQCGGS